MTRWSFQSILYRSSGISDPEVANLFAREWEVPWHSHVLPLFLGALLAGLWFVLAENGQMNAWALSGYSLHQGQWSLLFLHMFAHGGLLHLAMNVAALLVLSAPLISRLGRPPVSWARYFYVFVGSGLAGAALYLALNKGEAVSMLGSSGAIFGLLGAMARVHPATGEAVPISSKRTWLMAKIFAGNHLLLFGLLAAAAFVIGGAPMVAWEAHLGGLLFGFFAVSLFLKRP